MKRLNVRTYFALVRFYRDERGVATIFACFMIMMMVVVAGIGVDLMHNEMERTRMQNTLDRAVLAAADLDQTLAPDAVVQDYFDKAGMGEYLSSVNVDQGMNFRVVSAEASTVSETQFMHLMGVKELKVPAAGTAQEMFTDVEISLVLDISGSMGRNGRMANLQAAAKEFIDKLIRAETQDMISINIVPYAEHVNVGEDIFNAINNKNERHQFSYCLEIPNDNFDETELLSAHSYDQMQHFQWYESSDGDVFEVDWPVCPRESFETITAFSQNATTLKAQIDQFVPTSQTSIFLGVKWGAALLDPSSQGIVSSLIASGAADATFSGRPAAYSDNETLKTIVVMTDGENTSSHRIASWAYDSPSDYVHWANYNFSTWLNNNVYPFFHRYYYTTKYNSVMADMLTDQICTAAKSQGIVIWGVGFEVSDHGADVLRKCASSPSHFFRVEGVEISDAFGAIASSINQLRLTQ